MQREPRITVATPAVVEFVDQNLDAALVAAKADADEAMEKYVEARTKIAELEGLKDLRQAMGGTIEGAAQVRPLREVTGT